MIKSWRCRSKAWERGYIAENKSETSAAKRLDYYISVLDFVMYVRVLFYAIFQEEIQTILDLGVPTDRIMFANPCKLLSHIQYAAENNVQMVAFDSDAELRRIKSYFPAAQ